MKTYQIDEAAHNIHKHVTHSTNTQIYPTGNVIHAVLWDLQRHLQFVHTNTNSCGL